jgi:hypothetical protein
MKKFNQWLSENDEFEDDEMARMGELGLDDRDARDHISEMLEEWEEKPELKAAKAVLQDWIAAQVAKRINEENMESWEEALSELVQEFDLRSHGIFEVMLLGAADDEGVMIDM